MYRPAMCLGLACWIAAATALADRPYYVTEIAAPAGWGSLSAKAINDAGQVVGSSWVNGTQTAFVYDGSAVSALSSLGGAGGEANDINDAGAVVGWSRDASGYIRATRWAGATPADLGDLGGLYGWAHGVNTDGTIVGVSTTSGGVYHGFRHAGSMIDLDSAVMGSSPLELRTSYALSDTDLAAMIAWSASESRNYAMRVDVDGLTYTQLTNKPGGWSPFVTDINDGGTVAGGFSLAGDSVAAVWMGGQSSPTELPGAGGDTARAQAINNDGLIVGYADWPGLVTDRRAVKWESGSLVELATLVDPVLGLSLSQAIDVNDLGQILASGRDAGGQTTVILTPALIGDANGDLAVDDADYTLWADNYGQATNDWSLGDWNQDGMVDDADYTLWADNYGQTVSTVPAPAALALLIAAGPMVIRRRARG